MQIKLPFYLIILVCASLNSCLAWADICPPNAANPDPTQWVVMGNPANPYQVWSEVSWGIFFNSVGCVYGPISDPTQAIILQSIFAVASPKGDPNWQKIPKRQAYYCTASRTACSYTRANSN